jgi:hypothetical protein
MEASARGGAVRWGLGVALGLAVAAPALAQPQDGLHLMTKLDRGGRLETAAFLFRRGEVVRNPVGGTAAFDFAEARRRAPGRVGTYERRGERLVIRWGDGTEAGGRFRPDPPCFEWDVAIFCPVQPFAPGARLDGSFEGGTGGRQVRTTTIRFRADGRYEASRIFTGSISMRNSEEDLSSVADEAGTYMLAGDTLTLQPAGKPARRGIAFPYDTGTPGPQPRGLYFDGMMMLRQ